MKDIYIYKDYIHHEEYIYIYTYKEYLPNKEYVHIPRIYT